MEKHDVVVIGAGPAGLAVAAELRRRGVKDIVVLDREAEAGGVPRHCGHWGFGWESHRRLMSGPDYARRLVADAAGIDIRTATTVLEFRSPHVLRVHTARTAIAEMEARHIVIAAGARESSRAARSIGGNRVPGVMTTGQLQQSVYLQKLKPFTKPVIIGGEWVSFSALMTCKHAGIAPQAMLVEDAKVDAPWFFPIGARLRYGVPVLTSATGIEILGTARVQAVRFQRKGKAQTLPCDGIIVSGHFVGEEALLNAGALTEFRSTPDGFGHITLLGNIAGPLKTAGRCAAEARAAAAGIMERLA
ncbi:MAG: FAD-dependent oxidoreductase [Proteobacteria bacterium]|nr:FAD-dependent oxidoreductase [Pseudomonadota bacterium]